MSIKEFEHECECECKHEYDEFTCRVQMNTSILSFFIVLLGIKTARVLIKYYMHT